MAISSLSSEAAARSASAVHAAYRGSAIRGGAPASSASRSTGDKVTNKASVSVVNKKQAKENERFENDGNVKEHQETINDAVKKAYGASLPADAQNELDSSVKAALRETYRNGIADEHSRPKWGIIWGVPAGIIAASMIGTGLGVWHEGAQKDKVIRKLQAQQDSAN